MPLAPNLHTPVKSPDIALNNNWVGENFSYHEFGKEVPVGQGCVAVVGVVVVAVPLGVDVVVLWWRLLLLW